MPFIRRERKQSDSNTENMFNRNGCIVFRWSVFMSLCKRGRHEKGQTILQQILQGDCMGNSDFWTVCFGLCHWVHLVGEQT